MEFRIADTFTDSLTRLTNDEQKAVKTTAFDLQMNPSSPGMSFHKLDRAKDKNFWSVRVNSDLRLIIHRNVGSLLLCFVGHHDNAYDWAERRKLEIHPKTGAAQLIEIRETVKEIFIPVYIQQSSISAPKPLLFNDLSAEELLSYGVPLEWLKDVQAANEDSLFLLVDYLPAEASEALLELAIGGNPTINKKFSDHEDPFLHPDAKRRFRTLYNEEELALALDFPWDKWAVFLHPVQRQWVERDYTGPTRISGSAGTGKTIVALHRSVFLARNNPDARILLTTYSKILANALLIKLRRLVHSEPHLAERIEIKPLNEVGIRLYKYNIGKFQIVKPDLLIELMIKSANSISDHKFSQQFLLNEWDQVVDSWQLRTWEDYRDVKRLGRKTKLIEVQRQILWSIFENVINYLNDNELITYSKLFSDLASFYNTTQKVPYDYIIVDEAQDIGVGHLKLLAALGNNKPSALFFAGDLGQRIFQQPFSWKKIGVDIRGRSKTLTVNYRTSHQIRKQADLLLGAEVVDADGNSESRNQTISVFNGPSPLIRTFDSYESENHFIGKWIKEKIGQGLEPHEIGLFVRSSNEINRAILAGEQANIKYNVLDETVEALEGFMAICTMHLAKGLEFRAVSIMACDDEIIPLQERIETVADGADLEEIYNTERQLLYVACTRARDELILTGTNPTSEFLEDLKI